MATELTHYGAKVIHQFIELNGQFEKALQKKEIEYTYLPVSPGGELRNNVIKYNIDGTKKYAVLIDDHCCITEDVPEDGDWYGLFEDIRDQINGHEPRKAESKAHQVLVRAEEYAREEKQKEEENPLLALLAADKVTTHDIMRNYRLLGYNSNAFALMSHDDIDPEFWNKLMEEFGKCKY